MVFRCKRTTPSQRQIGPVIKIPIMEWLYYRIVFSTYTRKGADHRLPGDLYKRRFKKYPLRIEFYASRTICGSQVGKARRITCRKNTFH